MVNVKLFGLLRLDTGIKEFDTEAKTVAQVCDILLEKAQQTDPQTKVTIKNINACAVLVNGKTASKRTKLADGDRVVFMSMVAGG